MCHSLPRQLIVCNHVHSNKFDFFVFSSPELNHNRSCRWRGRSTRHRRRNLCSQSYLDQTREEEERRVSWTSWKRHFGKRRFEKYVLKKTFRKRHFQKDVFNDDDLKKDFFENRHFGKRYFEQNIRRERTWRNAQVITFWM